MNMEEEKCSTANLLGLEEENSPSPLDDDPSADEEGLLLLPVEVGVDDVEGEDEETPRTCSNSDLVEQWLFFVCGLGSSIGYIATLSALVYFKIIYGPNSFVDLNLAVYLPLLPISLAQARWDPFYDLRFKSPRTFLLRGVVGFGLSLFGTIRMSSHSSSNNKGSSLQSLIWDALLQGIGGAILYGTLNQLASFVGRREEDGRRLKATVSAGVQSSALVVLGISWVSGFFGTQNYNAESFSSFLWWIIATETLCFAMFLWLILARPLVAASMIHRDSSMLRLITVDQQPPPLSQPQQQQQYTMETPLMTSTLMDPSSLDQQQQQQQPNTSQQQQQQQSMSTDLSFGELWKHSKSCSFILIVTLVPSFLVGSWFTRVQTNWMALAQVLFYVRIGSDFLGRLATLIVPPKSIQCLTWTSIARLVPVCLFFVNSNSRLLPFEESDHNINAGLADMLSIFLVAIVAFLSGYLVTGCFQLAPQGLPWEIRDEANLLAKQASLLTVAFSVAAVGGLMSSFALIAIGV